MVIIIMNFHALSTQETMDKLHTSERGLTRMAAQERLKKYGFNKLKEPKKKGLLVRFLLQFKDFTVLILLAAAVVSFITSYVNGEGDAADSIIILLIVIVNAVIGVTQESRAQHAIDALKNMSAPHAQVLRDGKRCKVESEELVPGDIIFLETGDFVPADARLITDSALKTEESALTGESVSSEKSAHEILPEKAPIGDRKNMVFSATVVTSGHATAVVTDTGMNTQVGKIANLISNQETPDTPLQVRLARVGKILGIGALVICGVIFLVGVLQKTPVLDSFMLAVSLAVAAIPEGLPAIVTIVLSIGVQRMARQNAIIRNLPAVETLGSATVICSDKTGTLTQNKMTVTAFSDADGEAPLNGERAKDALMFAALCCNSVLEESSGKIHAVGEPTENALVTAAAKNGLKKTVLEKKYPRIKEEPFSSVTKQMATLHKYNNGYRVIVKGAPDVLLKLCDKVIINNSEQPLTSGRRQKITDENKHMAENALRVIAVAYRDVTSPQIVTNGLTFCGLLGMIDPPRKEVRNAVKTCKSAGIVPVMITGDHALTAEAIAKKLGISNGNPPVTGEQLENMSQNELEQKVKTTRVFARVSPEHKVRIVKAFRKNGEVTAMTGDGVNDAPALKAADIGCAMGKSGTDVAKNAADMILTDDNFATIVNAAEQGRGIYDNVRKSVHFLLSCNIGEILVIFVATVLGLPAPLLPIQLLWVNLVTDSLPAMALGVEKPDRDIMRRKPVPAESSLFSGGLGFDIMIEGMMVGSLAFLSFIIGKVCFGAENVILGRTMAFAVLSLSQLVHAFNTRSDNSLFKIGFFSNSKMVISFIICTVLQTSVIAIPNLAALFNVVPLNLVQWLIVSSLSLFPLLAVECGKILHNRNETDSYRT